MRHGPSALHLIALLVVVAATAAAQEEPKPRDLPDAPAAKQDSAPQKHQNPYNITVEVLGRRSIFFPNIATSVGPLSSKQKFELFADESVAPSRFLSSAAGGRDQSGAEFARGYGQELGGYGKRFGSSWQRPRRTIFSKHFSLRPCCNRDPRYFVTLHGGAGHRIGYALSRIVVSRKDDGRDAANWPEILGPLLARAWRAAICR